MPTGKVKITFRRKVNPPLTFVREWAGQGLRDVLRNIDSDEAMPVWVSPLVVCQYATKNRIEVMWESMVKLETGDRLIVEAARFCES